MNATKNNDFSQFLIASIIFHIIIFIFSLFSGFIPSFQNPIEITSNTPVRIRLGQVRNTRMKEHDKKTEHNAALQRKAILAKEEATKVAKLKEADRQKEIARQQEAKKQQEAIAAKEKEVAYMKTQKQLEAKRKKDQLELKQKSYPASIIKNHADNFSSEVVLESKFDNSTTLEDVSDLSSIKDCKSISDVHTLQFKNDVIELMKYNWNVPDCLIDKDISLTVLLTFDSNGFILNYEIKDYPNTKEYNILAESVKKLMQVLRKNNLPVNGRKLRSNRIILKLIPMFN